MKQSPVSRCWSSILLVIVVTLTIEVHGTHAAESPLNEFDAALLKKVGFGVNGEIWKRTLALVNDPNETKLLKLALLRGVLDGLYIGRSGQVLGTKLKDDDPYAPIYNTTYAHLIDALDQFYSDYRNEKIPVVFALRIISMELKGVPKETIDLTLTNFRRILSTVKEQ